MVTQTLRTDTNGLTWNVLLALTARTQIERSCGVGSTCAAPRGSAHAPRPCLDNHGHRETTGSSWFRCRSTSGRERQRPAACTRREAETHLVAHRKHIAQTPRHAGAICFAAGLLDVVPARVYKRTPTGLHGIHRSASISSTRSKRQEPICIKRLSELQISSSDRSIPAESAAAAAASVRQQVDRHGPLVEARCTHQTVPLLFVIVLQVANWLKASRSCDSVRITLVLNSFSACVRAGVPADRGHVVRDGDVRVPADAERVHEPGRAGEQGQPPERRAGQRRRGPAVQPARVPPLPRHPAAGGLPGPQPLLLRVPVFLLRSRQVVVVHQPIFAQLAGAAPACVPYYRARVVRARALR